MKTRKIIAEILDVEWLIEFALENGLTEEIEDLKARKANLLNLIKEL